MEWKHRSVLETLQRSQQFLDENAEAVGAVNRSGVRAELDTSIRGIQACAALQSEAETGFRSQTKVKNDLRDVLWNDHMRPISNISLKQPATVPPVTEFRMPSKDSSDDQVITQAIAMSNATKPHRAVFVAQQLPDGFIEELLAAAAALRQALFEREIHRFTLTTATLSLAAHCSTGRNALRILNTLVVQRLRKQPELLGAWHTARRYHVKPGSKRQPKAPA